MMLDEAARSAIVDALFEVYETRTQLKPLKERYPAITLEDAYRIQEAFIGRKLQAGGRVRGYKVGLTSKAMQAMAGSIEPDFSALTDDLFLPEDTPIAMSTLFTPLIEIEIAFVMKDALRGPGVIASDVIRATDFILPAIELVDMRVERGPTMSLADNIADLAFCGAVILGGNPRRLDQIDVRRVAGSIIKNGTTEQSGYASAVLGNPVTSVAWLINTLSAFGVAFEPGHVILTGSFVRAIPVRAGDQVVCRFDQGLGDVSVSFE